MRPVVGLLILVAFIAGCATPVALPPVEDVDAAWHLRQATLKSVTAWQVRGRLALRAADQGWHATLNWERTVNGIAWISQARSAAAICGWCRMIMAPSCKTPNSASGAPAMPRRFCIAPRAGGCR